MMNKKSICARWFSFINPKNAHYFLKELKKCGQFCCAVLMRSNKLVHLDCKIVAAFTQYLVQNLMDLVFFLKRRGSSEKMAKTKVVRETAKWRRSEAKG